MNLIVHTLAVLACLVVEAARRVFPSREAVTRKYVKATPKPPPPTTWICGRGGTHVSGENCPTYEPCRAIARDGIRLTTWFSPKPVRPEKRS